MVSTLICRQVNPIAKFSTFSLLGSCQNEDSQEGFESHY